MSEVESEIAQKSLLHEFRSILSGIAGSVIAAGVYTAIRYTRLAEVDQESRFVAGFTIFAAGGSLLGLEDMLTSGKRHELRAELTGETEDNLFMRYVRAVLERYHEAMAQGSNNPVDTAIANAEEDIVQKNRHIEEAIEARLKQDRWRAWLRIAGYALISIGLGIMASAHYQKVPEPEIPHRLAQQY